MRCVMCLNHLEEIKSDNLAIYRCRQPDCPLFRLYQAGLEEPVDVDLDELAERIIKRHKDEPPAAYSGDSIEDEPIDDPSPPEYVLRCR